MLTTDRSSLPIHHDPTRRRSFRRRNCLTLLAVMALVGFFTSPVFAQTLVNPGLEGAYQTLPTPTSGATAQVTGQVAPGWADNTNWTTTTINYAEDTSVFHGGTESQRIEATSGFVQFAQWITFPTSGTYQISMWLKAKTPTWVNVSLRQAAAPYATYASQPVRVGTDWTQASASGLVPAGDAIVLLNIGSDQSIKSPGAVVWVDDAALTTLIPTGQTLSPPQTVIPATYFGMNANHMGDSPGYVWPALPFGTFRTWDSGMIWPAIETARGTYNWTLMDGKVATAKTNGAQVLFTLGLSPQWAVAGGQNTYAGVPTVPDDPNDYKMFAAAVAGRYKSGVQAYEVWNEPDLNEFYTGTPAQLASLEATLAQAVHAVNPSAHILTPPISGTGLGSIQWLDAYLAAGGGQQADTIGYHLYSSFPENDVSSLQLIRSALAPYGLDKKPIWDTESGLMLTGFTQQDAAAHVARVALIDWAAGFQRFCWYAYDNTGYFGLDVLNTNGTTDPTTLAPPGVAYREVRHWMLGAKMISCSSTAQGVWTAQFLDSNGKSAWAIWNVQGTTSFAIPSAWHVTSERDLTSKVTHPSGGITITTSPVLLQQ